MRCDSSQQQQCYSSERPVEAAARAERREGKHFNPAISAAPLPTPPPVPDKSLKRLKRKLRHAATKAATLSMLSRGGKPPPPLPSKALKRQSALIVKKHRADAARRQNGEEPNQPSQYSWPVRSHGVEAAAAHHHHHHTKKIASGDERRDRRPAAARYDDAATARVERLENNRRGAPTAHATRAQQPVFSSQPQPIPASSTPQPPRSRMEELRLAGEIRVVLLLLLYVCWFNYKSSMRYFTDPRGNLTPFL